MKIKWPATDAGHFVFPVKEEWMERKD